MYLIHNVKLSAICESFDVFDETFIIRNTVFLPRQIGNDNKDIIK